MAPLITRVSQSIDKGLSRSSFTRKACEKFQDPKFNAAWIAGLGVGSIVLKDGFGCYLYVKQSLNNKKIPEDKRKFVAALDLANGGLMMLLQVLITYTISKKACQEKIFEKLFGKMFNRQSSKSIQAIMESKDNFKGKIKGNQEFHRALEGYRDASIGALASLTSLIAATTIGKRVITPFIATPLADKTKAWMCRNDKPTVIHDETKNTYDTQTPAVEKAKPIKPEKPAQGNLLKSKTSSQESGATQAPQGNLLKNYVAQNRKNI